MKILLIGIVASVLFTVTASAQIIGGGPVIGGGGSGSSGPATALQSPVVIEGTTADAFEGNFTFADPTADWTWAWGAAGDLVGAGSLSIDNLKLDGNTLSSTDTNGNINLTPNGSGQVLLPVGSTAAPGISITGHATSGLLWGGNSNTLSLSVSNSEQQLWTNGGTVIMNALLGNNGTPTFGYFKRVVQASTSGAGSPNNDTPYTTTTFTNEGSTALNYHALPTAASGYQYTYCVQDSDGIRVVANTGDVIRSVASVTTSGGYIESTTIGSCATILSINAAEWYATSITGTWSFN